MWRHCNSSWCCAVNVMLEKDSGQPKSKQLWNIHLFEADYNFFLKISHVGLETCLNVHQTKHMAWLLPEGLPWILSCLISWTRIYITCSRSTMLDSTMMPQLVLIVSLWRLAWWLQWYIECQQRQLVLTLRLWSHAMPQRGVQRLILRNTLGTFFSEKGRQVTESMHLQQSGFPWYAGYLKSPRLTLRDARVFYWSIYLPAMSYSLAAIVATFLPAMSFPCQP